MSLDEWKSHDLGSLIAELESGSRPKGGADDESGELPSLGGENIRSDGRLDVSSVRKVPRSFFAAMGKGILRNDDVLINKDGANTGKVGIYRGEFAEAAINEHVFRLRGREGKLHQGFLFYFLASQIGQQHIRSRISGSAQPGLKSSFVDQLPIALPTNFDVQPTVAKILERVDRAIEQTEALLAKQQRIKTGLMHDLLTRGLDAQGRLRDPSTHRFKNTVLGSVPIEWDCVIFGSKVELVHGYQFRDYDFVADGIPVVKITQVKEHGLDLQNCSFVHRNRLPDFPDVQIRAGDVLMALTGATLGKTCVAQNHSEVLLQNYRVGRFEPRQQDSVHKGFLYRLLVFYKTQRQIFDRVNSGAQGNIGKADFEQIYASFPSYAEQEKISNYLDSIDQDLKHLNSTLAKYRRLKFGLMHDLLTGRVPVTQAAENARGFSSYMQ